MKRLLAPVFLLSLFAAITIGCTNSSRVISTGLRVELSAIERAADGSVSVSWHIANSNIVAYLLSRTTHKIYLNGVFMGTIVDQEPIGVPANTNTGRTARLTGGDAKAASTLAEAAAHGSANYRVDTHIIIRIYDETTEKADIGGSGTVPVTAK